MGLVETTSSMGTANLPLFYLCLDAGHVIEERFNSCFKTMLLYNNYCLLALQKLKKFKKDTPVRILIKYIKFYFLLIFKVIHDLASSKSLSVRRSRVDDTHDQIKKINS
jgi:hypothetical protein